MARRLLDLSHKELNPLLLTILYSSQFLCDETAVGLLSNDTKDSLGFLRTQILGLRMQAAATEPPVAEL
jgi:hypothetical protein